MNKQHKKPRCDDMYRAILTLKTVDECKQFFDDLCTVTELQAMEQRYQVAQYLDAGLIYNDILEKTGASSATISRANRSLQYGDGGYEIVFGRLKEQAEKTPEACTPSRLRAKGARPCRSRFRRASPWRTTRPAPRPSRSWTAGSC